MLRILLSLALFITPQAWATEPGKELSMLEKAGPQQQRLMAFVAQKKFLAEGTYPGAMNEADRSKYESLINQLTSRLMPLADSPDPKPALMQAFKSAYPAFEYADTEERERALGYFEEIMSILGVASSDGLLNKLMYGFNPSQSVEARNQEALAAMSATEQKFAAQLDGLTRANAASTLGKQLGKPEAAIGATRIWLRGGDATDAVSLAEEADKTTLIWMIKGRFMYSRLLR